MKNHSLTGNFLFYGTDQSLPEIRWLSAFSAPDPLLLLVKNGELNLIVSPLEKGRALKESKDAKVWTLEELGFPLETRRNMKKWMPAVLEKFEISEIKAPFNTPFGVVEYIRNAGIGVELVEGEICPERAIKTMDEFAAIQESQRATAAAMQSAVDLFKKSIISENGDLMLNGEPLTSDIVRTEINCTLLKHNCIGKDTIVAGGKQAADPHNRGNGVLRAGEAVVIDIFPHNEKTGYFGDMTRTFCKGEPSAELKSLYDAVLTAQLSALKMVKAGVSGDEIHRAVQKTFDELGYKTDMTKPEGYFHGTGHGVGLEVHESPRVSVNAPELACGNVVTIEPGLYYPDLGGVRIEDTVFVTESGFEFSAEFPKDFVIL